MGKRVERVQTGVRLEKRLVKVLKGLAEFHDLSLADLMEGIFLHVLDGELPLSEKSLEVVASLKAIYGLDLTHEDAHQLEDR